MPENEGRGSAAALPDGPEGVVWRRIEAGDVDAVVAIGRRIAEAEDPSRPVGRADVERLLAAAGAPEHTALALEGGRPVAYGLVLSMSGSVRLPGGVQPGLRERGIGRRLLDWQVAQGRLAREDADAMITVRQPRAATGAARLLARAGFVPERTFLHLRRTGGPVLPSPLPAGLRSVPLDPRLDDALRIAHDRAFAEHWGAAPEGPEAWAQRHLGPALRRDLSRVALTADGGIAGFVLAWAQDEVPQETYLPLVGTDPDRRQQGIARALLAEVVAASTAAGRPVVALDVDGENATGALPLYASLGFERVLEAVMHRLSA